MTRSVEETAVFLLNMRQKKQILPNLPDELMPSGVDEAYAVQEQLVQKLLTINTDTLVGYKVACTAKAPQELLGVDEPFHGQLFRSRTFTDGAEIDSDLFTLRISEPEFAVQIGEDVPVRDEPYDAVGIRPYIAAVLPAIEIVDHRYVDFTKTGGLPLLVDNAILGAVVLGEPVHDWQQLDLAAHGVDFIINGEPFSTGTGANALGSPLNVLAWLANDLPKRGKQLKAGEIVMTGTITAVHWSQRGDQIKAEFGTLGTVSYTFI